ncbi:BnaC04g29270D [Brassica napus]|uniref:BnaC04g29270D protein n=1 Tax=Brassica napus TaxID=3708 RepID=A0A078FI96_BRANA|nr:BnaC04g29270D [Brassica napus]
MIATNIYPKLNAEDHPDDDMTGAVNLSMDSNPIVNNIGLDNTKSPTGVMLLHQSKAVQKCLNQFLRN